LLICNAPMIRLPEQNPSLEHFQEKRRPRFVKKMH